MHIKILKIDDYNWNEIKNDVWKRIKEDVWNVSAKVSKIEEMWTAVKEILEEKKAKNVNGILQKIKDQLQYDNKLLSAG